MSGTFNGCLFIADITRYTQYLTKSELEHAQEILADSLGLLVEHTRPPLTISRLAGDAVISYTLGDHFIQGQTFIEMIEDTYVAFRKTLEHMLLNNTCRCNACVNIANLDLKFFTHYGKFAIQRISDHDELVGSEVNLLHRLLKNHVVEMTGIKAYALYTQAAIDQLAIQEISQSMTEHKEVYEHLGETKVWIQNLHPVWESRSKAASLKLRPDQVLLNWQIEIDLTPQQVWDYLSQPEYLKTLIGVQRMEVTDRDGGRITSGSVYHFYHGKQVLPLTVLEWQPFERILIKTRVPIPLFDVSVFMEYQLKEIPAGTLLTVSLSRANGPLPGRWMVDKSMSAQETQGHEDMKAFKTRIESDASTHSEAPEAKIAITNELVSQEALASLLTIGQT